MQRGVIPEKAIDKALKAALPKGLLYIKLSLAGCIGIPDRLILGPNRLVIFAELKRPGKTLSPMQERWFLRLRVFGFSCYLIDSLEAIEKMILEEGLR